MTAHSAIRCTLSATSLPRRRMWRRALWAIVLAPAVMIMAGCTPPRQTPPPQAPAAPPVATQPPASVAPQVETLPPLDSDIKLRPPVGARETVTVAFLAPLSGPNAPLGQALLNAAQLALFDLGGAQEGGMPGGVEIALAPRDTAGTVEGAQRAVQEAIESGARLILGPVFSAEVEAVAPLVRARNIPLVSFSNDSAVAGNGVFVLGFTPEQQLQRVVAHAAGQGITRFAALVPESVYGNRVTATLQAAATAANGQVTRVETYDPALTTQGVSQVVRRLANYNQRHAALLAQRKELSAKNDDASRAALRRLQGVETIGDVDFEAIVVPESGERLKIIAPLLLFYDIDPRKVRALGTMDWDTPETWTEPALVGGWYPAPAAESHASFETAYREAYGRAAPPRASLGYDATALAVVLARNGGRAGFSNESLTAPNGFVGVDGIFRLAPNGVVERGLAVKEVGSRNSRIVSPAPDTFEKLSN